MNLFLLNLMKFNIKGDLRTVSYLYSENVGEANK